MSHTVFFFYDVSYILFFFFFFNDTATTEIYTLSLHDALPITHLSRFPFLVSRNPRPGGWRREPRSLCPCSPQRIGVEDPSPEHDPCDAAGGGDVPPGGGAGHPPRRPPPRPPPAAPGGAPQPR